MSGNTSTDIWIAGAFAAFSVDLLVYPLDTLKTRIQSPEYRQRYVYPNTNAVRTAALFRGLYQGMGSVILATLPSCKYTLCRRCKKPIDTRFFVAGAFFTTYEHSKTLFSYLPIPTPIAHSAASAVAECVSCAILTPAEVIKQNAQMVSQAAIAESHRSATRQTMAKFRRNPLALWRGYGALTTRNLPFTALQFPLFEHLKRALHNWNEQRRGGISLPLWERGIITAVAAGSAGALSAVVTTPIDVVKTRIMLAAAQGFARQNTGENIGRAVAEGRVSDAVDAVKEEATNAIKPSRDQRKAVSATRNKYPLRGPEEVAQNVKSEPTLRMSSVSIARDIVKEQGWTGLWRGGALRGAWTMLGSGLYLGVYESGRAWLEERRKARDD